MLSGVVNAEEIVGKDTESYYNVLFQNKTNRWIVRYVGDKKRLQVSFPIELTERICLKETGKSHKIFLIVPISYLLESSLK